MRTIPARAAEPVEARLVEDVAATFESCFTLADLMRWCERQEPRAQVDEIVTQDEYTHDVILPFGPAYLAFDTT